MKPYIIVHMMTSIDGRIDCSMLEHLSADEYYVALEQLGPCSQLSGRQTAALEWPAVREEAPRMEGAPIGREAFHKVASADTYAIVVDTRGTLRWQAAEEDGHPILCIVSEQVSEAYLETLKAVGISWIAVGKDRIDLRRALEILNEQFGVQRLAIVGGGHICGGFLEAGLVDEVSLMVAPGIDGRTGQTAVFDGITRQSPDPYHLRLEKVERVGHDVVWLRYKVQ